MDDDLNLAANEIGSTTDESTPGPFRAASHSRAASEARVENFVALLDEIGPVLNAPTKLKSNRDPKPGKTTILILPENEATLKEKQLKRKTAAEQKKANAAKKKPENTPTKAAAEQKQANAAKEKPKNTPTKTTKGKQASSAPKKEEKLTETTAKRHKPSTSTSTEEDTNKVACEGCAGEVDVDDEIYTCAGKGCLQIAHQRCITLKNRM